LSTMAAVGGTIIIVGSLSDSEKHNQKKQVATFVIFAHHIDHHIDARDDVATLCELDERNWNPLI